MAEAVRPLRYLAFEQPLETLDAEIARLAGATPGTRDGDRLRRLRAERRRTVRELLERLTPWERVQLSRHPDRPGALDYVQTLCRDFVELHGDRRFGDDGAVVGGLARFRRRAVVVVAQQRPSGPDDATSRNFGMPRPEGYRKAVRLFELAERFRRPVVTFIDTQGAYPGLGAEERGQAEAIASSLRSLATLRVPVVTAIVGEGGSGGALAIAVGDRVNMLEHAIYSVISAEGCAAILWRDSGMAKEAARALRITAPDLRELGLIDDVIAEPPGGAHADPTLAAALLDAVLKRQLEELGRMSVEQRLQERYLKFRAMGKFSEDRP
jgi:acetyl-CoA carboxylase carboxyl transferase subunit alpha